MLQRTFTTLTAIICAALLPLAARAAELPATIAGTGEASVKVVPTKLRIQVPVVTHGKTTELAVQRLKARREVVADNLCALGADKQSLNFGDSSVYKVGPTIGPSYPAPVPYLTPAPAMFPYAPPSEIPAIPAPITSTVYAPATTSPVVTPPSARQESTAPMRPRGSLPELFEAMVILTIDWPLQAHSVDEAVLSGEAVGKKIVAVGDLMRGKAAEKLPADERELLDELPVINPSSTSRIIQRPVVQTLPNGQPMMRIVEEQQLMPAGVPFTSAQPTYLYVATISSSQRKALLGEAFFNAKSQAAELAEASGGKLGAVSNLIGEVGKSTESIGLAASPTSAPSITDEKSNETTATSPGGLRIYAKVHALFRLE
jgi:uncharacterized protein YggE